MYCRKLLIIPAIIVFIINTLLAGESFSQNASAGKISSVSENLNVDSTTGTASMSIPIEVPPGRAGIEPNVALLYNSSSPNGFLGMGWSLDTGSIARSTKRGVPKYDSRDSFVFMQSGSRQELVDISGNQTEFRFKNEGAFMKIKNLGNAGWVAVDKKGTKYFFGQTSVSRLTNPHKSNIVFKWCLDHVEDLSGNYMDIYYLLDWNELYPSEIRYTGNSQTNISVYASVKFTYDDTRPDILRSFNSGFEVRGNWRLSTIDVKADGNLLRSYKIEYARDTYTKRSLLSKVTQFGSDGTSILPPVEFTYSQGDTNFYSPINLANHPPHAIVDGGLVRVLDMNRDGLPDLLDSTSGGSYRLYINRGNFNFAPAASVVPSPPVGLDNPGYRLADFTGDGLLDIMDGRENLYALWVNTGTGSFNGPMSTGPSFLYPLSGNNIIQFIDMNTDGLTDIVETHSGQAGGYKIYLNNGNYGFNNPVFAVNSPFHGTNNADVMMADFNGDGLLDVIWGETNPYSIWLNNGRDGYTTRKYVGNCPNHSLTYQNVTRLVDFNGDGLTDILESTTGNNPEYSLWLNNGKVDNNDTIDFNNPISLVNPPPRGFDNPNVKLMDMNADGFVDIIFGQPSAGIRYQVWLNNGFDGFFIPQQITSYPNLDLDDNGNVLTDLNRDGLPDLLRGVPQEFPYKVFPQSPAQPATSKTGVLIYLKDNHGLDMSIDYAHIPIKGLPETQYKTAYSPILFQIARLKRLTIADEGFWTHYQFSAGLWNYKEREFRGFEMVKTLDADNNFTITTIAQDDIFKGRLLEKSVYDYAGRLFSKAVNTWGVSDLGNGSSFVFLKEENNYIYNGDATGKRTQNKYFYDLSAPLGNMNKMIQMGEVDLSTGADVGSDRRTVEMEYVNNASGDNWIVGLPKHIVTKDAGDNIVRQSWLYYDGSADLNTVPTKGFLTKRKDWAGDGAGVVHPEAKYTYDAVGNLMSTQDANENISSVTYDSQWNLFPLTTKNARDHQVVNEYYGIAGVPVDNGSGLKGLWGQLKSTTDPNDQKGRRSYDIFGRTTFAVSPVDTISLPTSTSEYQVMPQYTKVKTRQRKNPGQPQMQEAVSFYDSLGRVLETKTPTENPGVYAVSGQTKYNTRGLPIKKYMPYLSNASMDTLDPVNTSQPYTTFIYDSMGRVFETWNPDGTHSNVVYNDDSVETIDENGHKQISRFDAYGRLIKKEEYKGADGRGAPEYPDSPYTLYAMTLYNYDSEGNLVSVTDAQGNTTTIHYDKLGQKTFMNDRDMGIWNYGYDANGNLKNQLDPKNQQLSFTYDVVNRLVTKTQGSRMNVNYSYDDALMNFSKGRLTKAQDAANSNTQFSYDELGREIKSVKKIDGVNYEVNRSYDDLNRLVSIQYPLNGELNYTYNDAGQIETASGTFGQITSPPAVPDAPTLNNPTAGSGSVSLSWNSVSGATSYKVKYGTTSGTYPTMVDAAANTTATINNLINGTAYYFVVAASNASGTSGHSNEKSATPAALPGGQTETIAFDNSNSAVATSSSSLSFTHVVNPNGTNRMLVVGFQIKHSSTAIVTSVTYAGQNLILIDRNVTVYMNQYSSELWYLKNPPTGANTVSATLSTSVRRVEAGLISLTGVKQQAPEITAKNNGNSNLASVSLITQSDGAWVIDSLMGEISLMTVTPGSGQTQRYFPSSTTGGAGTGSSRIVAMKGPATMSWSLSLSRVWSIVAAAFAPAPRMALLDFEKNRHKSNVVIASEHAEGGERSPSTRFACSGRVVSKVEPRSKTDYKKEIAPSSAQNIQPPRPAAFATKRQGGRNDSLRDTLRMAISYLGEVFGKVFGVTDAYAAVNFDFTTFTEADPTNKITKTADCISFNNIETQMTNAFVYKGYTTSGDFHYTVDMIVSASDTFSGPSLIWGISNTPNANYSFWTDGIYVSFNKFGALPRMELFGRGFSAQASSTLTVGQRYYLTISRSGNAISVKIYSNSARTALVSTLTANKTARSYPYLYAFSSKNYRNLTGYKMTGDVCRLVDNIAQGVPNAPTLDTPTVGDRSVSLSWNSVSGATSYKVKYGTASGTYPTTVDAAANTTATINNLINGTTYYFVAAALNATGESINSNEKLAMPQAPAPAAPALNSATPGDKSVTLTWAASANATSYSIKYGTTSGSYGALISVTNVTTYTVSGLTNNTAYFFVVTASNASGASGNSNEKTATPQPAGPVTFVRNVDYSVNGQITRIEFGNGNVTTYTYHPYNLRLTKIKTSGSQNNVIQDLSYTYDKAGNITSITDTVNTASQTFKYDELNRLVYAQGNYGTKNYAYDKIGNIMAKDNVNYTYGENGAGPHAVTSGSDGSTFAYDASGNMKQMVKNGANWDYIYDAENRLVEVRKNSLVQAKFAYDGDGGRTKKIAYQYSGGVASKFLEGTLIQMADGKEKPIEAISAGDWVLSLNPNTLLKDKIQVTKVYQKEEMMDKVVIINDRLKTAPTSIVYSQGRWQLAETLESKDHLLDSDLSESSISSIKTVSIPAKHHVYNLELARSDNFFADGFLVQNRVDEFRRETKDSRLETQYAGHHTNGDPSQVSSLESIFDPARFTDYGTRIMDFLFNAQTAEASNPATITTRYVGNLFEASELQSTRHIFLGGTRIASITNGQLKYYHSDHLGGTNLITNNTGVVKQLVEYEPFGLPSKNERYGTVDEEASHLFTGKELDEETGLYYYGARYYNPVIGRFITADTLIQDPYNPQTLNRYSYTSNNPINRIDPDGHGWFKKFIQKWAGLFGFVGGIVKGVTTGDWSTVQNMGTALVTSAVLSWGNPIAIASSVLAAGFMDTPPGHQFSRFMSEDVFDDAFGMRPRAAYVVGNMVSTALVSSAIYIAITPSSYAGPDYRNPVNREGAISKYGIEGGNTQPGGSTTNYIAEHGGKNNWYPQGRVASDIAFKGTPGVDKVFEALNVRHAAVVVNKGGTLFDSAKNIFLKDILKGQVYASPWTATSHQAFFRTLIDGGMSGTQALGTATSQAGWSFYLTSSIYGVEGHSGAVGIINAEVNRR